MWLILLNLSVTNFGTVWMEVLFHFLVLKSFECLNYWKLVKYYLKTVFKYLIFSTVIEVLNAKCIDCMFLSKWKKLFHLNFWIVKFALNCVLRNLCNLLKSHPLIKLLIFEDITSVFLFIGYISGYEFGITFFCDRFLYFRELELIQWIILGISMLMLNSLGIRFWNFVRIFENFWNFFETAWVMLICVGVFES